MDIDGVPFNYRVTLHEIDNQLGKRDISSLKFLCTDILPRSGLEDVTRGIILFTMLEKKNYLSQNNTSLLAELLYRIQRNDLLKKLDSSADEIEARFRQNRSQLPPYRVMLYKICDDLTKKEMESLLFAATAILPKSRVEDIKCAEEFIVALEQSNLLQASDTQALEHLLIPLKRPDLQGVVRKYKNEMPHLGYTTSNVHTYPAGVRGPPTHDYPQQHSRVPVPVQHREQMQPHRQHVPPAINITHDETLDDYYKMDAKPRGICLIINNETFYQMKDDPESKLLLPRQGTDIDCRNLENTFRQLDFDVHTYQNLTDTQLFQVLNDFTHRRNHSHFDCFVCCILSHGIDGSVYGTNGKTVLLRDITTPFKAQLCPSLAGKPKLFFIQACQGKTKQLGYSPDLQIDAPQPDTSTSHEQIPNEADFLLGQATVAGFVSYRSKSQGSWYITTLTQMLDQYARSLTLLDILVKVNNEVGSKNAPNYGEGGELYQMKQIPMPAFTLRKRVLFK